MESSRPDKHSLPATSEHHRPTIPAPNVPLPAAAMKPGPPPRPAAPPPHHEFAEDELPTGALFRPPKVPSEERAPSAIPPAGRTTIPVAGRSGTRSRTERPSLAVRPRLGKPGEPSVLLVGAPPGLSAALEPALARHRVHIEKCTTEEASDAVIVIAPDLVVLAGDATRDSGHHILRALAASPQSSVVPVALLDDNTELESRLRAFRHGAAAVIPRSASMDEMAERISTLAREIPERDAELLGDVGEATLEDLVNALGKELRSGILSVRVGGGDESAVRVVLGGGRALSDTIDEFVQRVREHIVAAEPLRYEFDERAGGTVQLLGSDETAHEEGRPDVKGLRVVLADDDAARADAVAQELRDQGVDVVVTDLAPSEVRFHRIRTMDPAVLLIGDQQAKGAGYELMRRMRRDTRLRWAALLVVRWSEVWSEQSPVPAVDRILGPLAALAEPMHALKERAASGVSFDTRLEITGPARMLRALAAASRPVRVTIQSPRVRVRLDLAEGLVVGATGETADPMPRELTGATALAAILVVSNGRVHVEPTEQPATANLMSTPDVALNMAEAEPPPIPPSLPIPARPGEEPPRVERYSSRPPRPAPKKASGLGTVAWALGGLLGVLVLGGGLVLVVKLSAGSSGDAPRAPRSAVATSSRAAPAPTASAPAPARTAAKPPPAPPPLSPNEADALSDAPTCDALLGPPKAGVGVYPGAAWDQVRAARRALVRGDANVAEGAYCQAVRFDPKNAEAMAGLSRVLMQRRDPHAAAEWAREAVKTDPENRSHQLLLGDALALGGELVKAAEPILLGFGLSPSDAEARKNAVSAQLRQGSDSAKKQDQSAAERAYRRALVLDPENADAAVGIARALLEQDQPKAAAHWARRASTLNPKAAGPQVVLGDALSKLGEKTAASAAWRKAVELDPNDPAARARAVTAE